MPDPELHDFDSYRIRRFEESDDEVAEWSAFMGRPVTPMEIVELKIQFSEMLDREEYSKRHE